MAFHSPPCFCACWLCTSKHFSAVSGCTQRGIVALLHCRSSFILHSDSLTALPWVGSWWGGEGRRLMKHSCWKDCDRTGIIANKSASRNTPPLCRVDENPNDLKAKKTDFHQKSWFVKVYDSISLEIKRRNSVKVTGEISKSLVLDLIAVNTTLLFRPLNIYYMIGHFHFMTSWATFR